MRDLAIIETILRNRYHYFNEIREGIGLQEKMRAMLVSSIAFLALYGAVMGSTPSLWQPLSPAVNLPIPFLAPPLARAPRGAPAGPTRASAARRPVKPVAT